MNLFADALKLFEAFDFLDQVKEFFEIDDVFGGSVRRLLEFENQLMSGGHAPPDGGGRIKRMKHDRGSVATGTRSKLVECGSFHVSRPLADSRSRKLSRLR